jgi:hypothetical protein
MDWVVRKLQRALSAVARRRSFELALLSTLLLALAGVFSICVLPASFQ